MDNRECFNNNFFARNMVDHVVAYHDNDMDPIEIVHCKNLINKHEYLRNQRLECLEEAFEIAQENSRE